MAVERQPQLTEILPEEITIGPELANAPHHRVLEEAYLQLDIAGNGIEFEDLLEEWGRKILSWWSFNIRSGMVKTEYVGDSMDGQWICTYDREDENAQLKIDVTSGFIDSPKLTSKVRSSAANDTDWEATFNNKWLERIKNVVYEEDPRYEVSATRKTSEIYHPVPQFRTKPPTTSWFNNSAA